MWPWVLPRAVCAGLTSQFTEAEERYTSVGNSYKLLRCTLVIQVPFSNYSMESPERVIQAPFRVSLVAF